MKTYKMWEVLKLLTSNQMLQFRNIRTKNILSFKYGEGYFIFTTQDGFEQGVTITSNTLDEEYELVSDSLLDVLKRMKEQYEMEFTKEELNNLNKRDETIYSILKEIIE